MPRKKTARVPVGKKINFEGRVTKQKGKVIFTEGQAASEDGLVYATATAKYERLGLAYSLREVRPPPDGRMKALGQMLQAHGLEVTIGG